MAIFERKADTYPMPTSILLAAIIAVESGGSPDPAHAVGDHGLAHGWVQAHHDYYMDAKAADGTLPPYAKACESKEASVSMVRAYWKRWGPVTDRERALCHHYGVSVWRRDKNADPDGYWKKIKIKVAQFVTL